MRRRVGDRHFSVGLCDRSLSRIVVGDVNGSISFSCDINFEFIIEQRKHSRSDRTRVVGPLRVFHDLSILTQLGQVAYIGKEGKSGGKKQESSEGTPHPLTPLRHARTHIPWN